MKVLKLKNGSEEIEPLVMATMTQIRKLMSGLPGALDAYERVQLCKDRKHEMFGDSLKNLQNLALIESSGSVHDSIRNVVLSAAVGDGLELHFENPIQEQP
jgi:hypothetical protein